MYLKLDFPLSKSKTRKLFMIQENIAGASVWLNQETLRLNGLRSTPVEEAHKGIGRKLQSSSQRICILVQYELIARFDCFNEKISNEFERHECYHLEKNSYAIPSKQCMLQWSTKCLKKCSIETKWLIQDNTDMLQRFHKGKFGSETLGLQIEPSKNTNLFFISKAIVMAWIQQW